MALQTNLIHISNKDKNLSWDYDTPDLTDYSGINNIQCRLAHQVQDLLKKTAVKISFGRSENVFLNCHLAFKQIRRLIPAFVHTDRYGVSLL